jgi:nucleoside-diphosphate-sugar epimerase
VSPERSGAILVTGASGFVGRHALGRLLEAGRPAIAMSRAGAPPDPTDLVPAGLLRAEWRTAPPEGAAKAPYFAGAAAVIHAAGLAHQSGAAPEAHQRINRDLALETARAAAEAGVRRFVLVSSIAVHGLSASLRPLDAQTPIAPASPYGVAKAEAERGLCAVAADTGLEVVVVRPALVCGARAPGNLAVLARALARGVPMPLASVANRRSLIEVGDLGDLLQACALRPEAVGGIYLAGDPRSLSTPEIAAEIGAGLGRPSRLWACPPGFLRALGGLTGRQRILAQLTESLEVDTAPCRRDLAWQPVRGVRAGLRALGAALPRT